MCWRVMPTYEDYEAARAGFEWDLPDSYNPAADFCRKHDPERPALHYDPPTSPPGTDVETHTFGEVDERSDRLATGLAGLGVEPGDCVGVVVPQKPANPTTHLANWKLGAISVPLTVLFGPDALAYRLADSEATAVVCDSSVRDTVQSVRDSCPALEHVIEVGSDSTGDAHHFSSLVRAHEPGIDLYDSTPATPTAIMYTSGSTGPPKGVLHSHALWLGRAAAAYNYFDQGLAGATLWTPADWAWGAALGGTLFAAWHHGCPVVGWPRDGFDAEEVFALLEAHDVTHSFMPPTALRMLQSVTAPERTYDLSLETLAAAGEPLTPELLDWVETTFTDVSLNEFYGQTELNLVVATVSAWSDPRPGSMGKPLPGYEVTILDPETHEEIPSGEPGELAVRPGDRRVFFDEYWGLPAKTDEKENDSGWFLTGDLVERDEDERLWFISRTDDVILTRGYRVGPMEVESAILRHDAVEQVGVVGVPDETTGEAIAAFVEPVELVTDSGAREELEDEIRHLVRERLAEYEYPEHVVFVDDLPQTATGKIRRKSLRESFDIE